MKIICLNTWHGGVGKPFFDFMERSKTTTDIFCLQEVSESLHKKLTEILDEFNGYVEYGDVLTEMDEMGGQAFFIRKFIEVKEIKKIYIHEIKVNDIGFLYLANLNYGDKLLNIGNVHGTSTPATKIDSEIRTRQSKIIIESFAGLEGSKVIGGDFNLLPDTASIEMFETAGYKNLIKEFDIKSTRNKIAWERFENQPGYVKQLYADYVFVSPDVKVINFEVPEVEVSDHNPMILEIDI